MKNVAMVFGFSFYLVFSVSAQGYQEVSYYNDAARKDFFLGFGFKGNVYLNNSTSEPAIWKSPTLGVNIFAGHWFSRYFGGRLLFEGGKLTPYFQKKTIKVEENYVLSRLDLLVDMTSTIYGYSRDRVYSCIPYAGVSGAYVFNAENRPDKADRSTSFFFGVGLLNSFRMSNNLSTYLNFGLDIVGANMDGYKDVRRLNGIASASVGLVVDF